jgi:hypothetical protein
MLFINKVNLGYKSRDVTPVLFPSSFIRVIKFWCCTDDKLNAYLECLDELCNSVGVVDSQMRAVRGR